MWSSVLRLSRTVLLLAGERLPRRWQAGLAAVCPDGQRHRISGLGRMAVGAARCAWVYIPACACACICGHLDSVCTKGRSPRGVTHRLRRSDREQKHGGSASCYKQVPGRLWHGGVDLDVLKFRWLFETGWGSPANWRIWELKNRNRGYGKRRKEMAGRIPNKVVGSGGVLRSAGDVAEGGGGVVSNLGTCAMYCCGAVPGPGACALVWSKILAGGTRR